MMNSPSTSKTSENSETHEATEATTISYFPSYADEGLYEQETSFSAEEQLYEILSVPELDCHLIPRVKTRFYHPPRPFNSPMIHEILGRNCYKKYQVPLPFPTKPPELDDSSSEPSIKTPPAALKTPKAPVSTIFERIQRNLDVEYRCRKTSFDYLNRDRPWYIDKPKYPLLEFEITDEMREKFSNPFEYAILRNIHAYRVRLMLIDIHFDIPHKDLECWLKFGCLVHIVLTVRSAELARTLEYAYKSFHAIAIENLAESTWQGNLSYALCRGAKYAKELDLYENVVDPIIYVFAQHELSCKLDTFSILRKK